MINNWPLPRDPYICSFFQKVSLEVPICPYFSKWLIFLSAYMIYQVQLCFFIHAAPSFWNDLFLLSSQVHFILTSGGLQIPNISVNAN